MKFFGFRGGVHPPENKIQTEHLPIEKLESPNEIFVPLLQHIGAPLNPIVNVGDRVLKGQKIADAEGLAVPVHSPVSGTVTKIESRVFPLTGKVMTVFIQNDKKEEWAELTKIANWETADKKELLDIIREKGIVGIGGATFPTHVKLNPPPNTQLDSLILNGAECEPYLNSDNRLMLENPKSIVEGIKIIKKILNVPNVYVGIEDNKPEAIESMRKATEGTGTYFEGHRLKVKKVGKIDNSNYSVLDAIQNGDVDIVINTTTKGKSSEKDGFKIRRKATEHGVICFTSLDTANALLRVIESMSFRVQSL